ncbi:MAG: 50S ribosomal protein P1 [Candidatus Diapherotrites archaeon]|nr:50S ribosomal protein P1 [Candidatus Diapherotrites archaeon]
MEYIYSAMLLHSAGKPVSEDAVKKILQSAGVTADDARTKALVASLKDVNIDDAIAKASVMQAAAPTASAPVKVEAKKEEVEEKKTEEEAASGLSALFG